MKRGYKRLLILLISLIIILLINTFYLNILVGYKMIIFLILLLITFNICYVLEKDNHRYFKEVLIEILLYVLFFFVIYYLLGLVVGLYRTQNYFTLSGLKNFFIPIISYTILKEILRYNMLSKADGNILCTILVVIVMILFDVSTDYYIAIFDSQYKILKFIALSLLPAISTNISYSYITKRMGYKPVIVFDLIFALYPYIIPILPDPSEYIVAIIYLLVPILFAYKIVNFFERKKDKQIPSNYHKNKFVGMLLPTTIVLLLVYFYSGYFRFYAVAIASGSMEPVIHKGDVVIIDQKARDFEVGEVMAFKRESIIVVHRVFKKQEMGDAFIYYTKGDANSNVDDIVIEEDMIVGKVGFKIPFVGYPTVWFNKK